MGSTTLFPETDRPQAAAAKGAGFLQAHCDGGARGNPGPSGYGAVIADEAGHVLAELSEYLGHRTNNFAEYSGLLGVLGWTLEHGHTRLRVVSDSELMVKQVQGRYKVNSPDLRPLFEEAKRRIGRLERFEISHALRHKNKVADRLANEAMDRGTGRSPQGMEPRPASAKSAMPAGSATAGGAAAKVAPPAITAAAPSGTMLRGFVRDGVVHPLGGAALPEGSFVKIICE